MTFSICSSTQYDQVLADFSKFYKNELKHAKLNDSLKKMIVMMILMLKNFVFYGTKSCPLLSKLS